MTLVALGLLLGMVGLLWVMGIDIMQADHQTKRQSPRAQDKPLSEAARCESNGSGPSFGTTSLARTSFSMAAER
jgi:hypothetical protein